MEASFTFRSEDVSPILACGTMIFAGGGILDVGGYATSITRLVAGAAVRKPFADPLQCAASASYMKAALTAGLLEQ